MSEQGKATSSSSHLDGQIKRWSIDHLILGRDKGSSAAAPVARYHYRDLAVSHPAKTMLPTNDPIAV
ncbi:hypothetical protein PG996_009109 [Apiospora saccharicola]|uniref:Uncharacterized protein n=1 Tax=Apiospora saccharicola TaxID=335842 RepID=A0ABR1UMU7_9PEZI